MKTLKIMMVAGAATVLSSCDLSQIPGLDGKMSIEDSKAVGAACRHSGRALEDCFTLNPNAHHAGVFEGWRDMNDYMISNNIPTIKPEIQPSAFQAGKEPSASLPARQQDAGSSTAGQSTQAEASNPVPVAPRERWDPKALQQAPAPAPVPAPAEQAAESEDAASPPPSRPWERKKDPKNHT